MLIDMHSCSLDSKIRMHLGTSIFLFVPQLFVVKFWGVSNDFFVLLVSAIRGSGCGEGNPDHET